MFVSRLLSTTGKRLAVSLLLVFIWSWPALAEGLPPSKADMPALISLLADTDSIVRTNAARVFKTHGQASLPLLLDSFQSADPQRRRGSIMGVTLLPAPALGIDTLLLGLNDKDVGVRSLSAQGLALIGAEAASYLVDKLASPSAAERDAAGFGLKLIGKDAVPALSKGLTTSNEFARAKAAWILGRIGTNAQGAIPALIRALDVADPRAMHVVAEAIDLIGPSPSLAIYHLTLLDADTVFSTAPVGSNAAPILIRLLSRPGTPLAQLAFHSLAVIGSPAIPALKEGVQNGPIGKQVACALALLEIDPDAADELPENVLAAIRLAQRQLEQ